MVAKRRTSSEHDSITALVKRAYQLDRSLFAEAMVDLGISVGQYGVLRRVVESSGISGADLARTMSVTPQAVQVYLTELEQQGLIRRARDRGRVRRAVATKAGQDLIAACAPVVRSLQEGLLRPFTSAEREMLTSLLERYVAVAEARLDPRMRPVVPAVYAKRAKPQVKRPRTATA